jgi:hypothetical protein
MFDWLIPSDFVGQPKWGGMSIELGSQKAFSAPAGRHVHAQMSLLKELERFFLAAAINITRRQRFLDA